MKKSLYKCKNKNCTSAIPPEVAMEYRFNVCPSCGSLYPQTIEYIENFFRIIQLSRKLNEAQDLLLKSKMDAAVREALLVFETTVREKSELNDLMGSDLMAKAFSYKFDQDAKIVSEEPRVKVNDLSSLSKRNEQEGIKFISMGLMQGIRNIYMHSKGTRRLYYCVQIITLVDLLLKQVVGEESVATSSE